MRHFKCFICDLILNNNNCNNIYFFDKVNYNSCYDHNYHNNNYNNDYYDSNDNNNYYYNNEEIMLKKSG